MGKIISKNTVAIAVTKKYMLGDQSRPQLDNIKFKMKPQEIFKVIKDSSAFKKDSKMPNVDISDEIVAYITLFYCL
ncbi:MAG: hypothetical protein QF907_05895 [Nitrospinota bacterium]|nr:hypothetical protein [Nitrospinota bacterium]MDP7350488.1 hypothetical protein [Nitrospinota bacterium]MDP7581519.1 hypothetical protein [Nitrospinota bacterium]HJN02853.1 hypothetical protein [Nitrospinota bacterium]